MICLCLNYYHTIITNFVEQVYNETIFRKDSMSSFYTKEIVEKLLRTVIKLTMARPQIKSWFKNLWKILKSKFNCC